MDQNPKSTKNKFRKDELWLVTQRDKNKSYSPERTPHQETQKTPEDRSDKSGYRMPQKNLISSTNLFNNQEKQVHHSKEWKYILNQPKTSKFFYTSTVTFK